MTNRLEISWKLDGFVDEQRYYCSETPIDLLNLPPPKVILAGDVRTYVDTVIEIGKTYYVCVGSVKNGIEKISDEISVYSKNLTHYTVFFDLNGNLIDRKGGASLALIEGVLAYENNALKLNGSSYVRRAATEAIHFATGDFTVECEFKAADVGSSVRDQVLINTFASSGNTWQMVLSPAGKLYIWYYAGSGVTLMQSPSSYLDGNWHRAKWTRSGNINKLYVDNVEVASATNATNWSAVPYFDIGAQSFRPASQAYYFKGLIKNVGIAKQAI